MRQVPPAMDAAWLDGDFSGDRRCMARVTVQHLNAKLFNLKYNLYCSFVFGGGPAPRELPNVKSVKWTRGVDTDVATGTVEFYNTAPQPLGTVYQKDYGLDQPGYYTFRRGATSFSSRFGHVPNVWQRSLVPDNVLKTYEGYGFDPEVCPDKDPHLVQTGFWIIKEVEYTAAGLIVCTVEDMGALLRDQVCFPPVIPKNFYPLSFSSVPKKSGFQDGMIVSTQTTLDPNAGYSPPAGWTGPTAAPTQVVTAAIDSKKVEITWDPPAAPPAGYTILGYDTFVDNVQVGNRLAASARRFTYTSVQDGNVYLLQVATVYEKTSTRVNISGVRDGQLVRPHGGYTAVVTPGSIQLNSGPPPATGPTVPVLGSVRFESSLGDSTGFRLIRYDHGRRDVFTMTPGGSGVKYFQTGQGDLTGANFLIYPIIDVAGSPPAAGEGEYYASDGAFYAPPQGSKPPTMPSTPTGPTVTKMVPTPAGPKPVVVPLKPVEVAVSYSDNSNGYYVGHGENVSVHGHTPHGAIDGNETTYWLSIGNERNDQGYSYEWFQVNVPNVELTEVKIKTAKAGYAVYVSVYANGAWVHSKSTDVIPYDPKNPESHNGANIPYFAKASLGNTEGPHTITLPSPVKSADKVRVTFHQLQNFGVGAPDIYRAGLRSIHCFGIQPPAKGTTPVAKPPAPKPVTPTSAGTGTQVDTSSSSTTYVPPKEIPGAGEMPGTYEDYTDIVKLMCAWGGLYWPDNGTVQSCDGTVVAYSFGTNNLGFKDNDPVLGDQAAGRVWGDFLNTGTAGIAALPIPQWDKKSLLDGINYVRDIIGFVFYIDEEGAAVWRLPNWFALGNYVGDRAVGASRVSDTVVIDEKVTLIELRAKLSSRNVRERYFVAGVDGVTGALAKGFNPNPTGLRRIAGWTDQHFGSDAECQVMADLIAVRALMAYHRDTLQIVGYPRIQVDDQVRIYEQTTNEGYLHYVEGISSNNDLENGVWVYDLSTQWLGETPFDQWAFNPGNLSAELKQFLEANQALGTQSFAPPPSAG